MDNYTRGILKKLQTACSRKLAITKIQYEQALAYHEYVKNEIEDDDEWRSDLEEVAITYNDGDKKKASKRLQELSIKLNALQHEHMFLNDKLHETEENYDESEEESLNQMYALLESMARNVYNLLDAGPNSD